MIAPEWNSIVPATWVATSTGMVVPLSGSLVTRALVAKTRSHAGDALHRADQVDEGGNVIRTHVEHRSGTLAIVETGIGMPAFVAGTHEESGAGDGAADGAFID